MGEADNDWPYEVYTTLLVHTNMDYDQIGERSIPQLQFILQRLGKHIAIKVGLPGGLGGMSGAPDEPSPEKPAAPPTLSQFEAFANAINGVG